MSVSTRPQNIIIDTDLGDDVDDLLCIAFGLLRPELSVKAITAVSYETDLRCHLISALLRATGQGDVPYAPGIKLPLRPATATEIQQATEPTGYILNQYPVVEEADKVKPPSDDAVELIAQLVDQYANDITLVCIAPLTNIATALCRYPKLRTQISRIALMGGELGLHRREHNINWDAHAADIVFNSGIPLFMGTWDVTRGFYLNEEDCGRIGHTDTPLCRLLHESIKLWWPHKAWKPGPVMYDVAPILWSYAPEYFTSEPANVQVELGGQYTKGYTVRAPGEPNARVSTAMRAQEIHDLYLDTILGAV